MRIILIVAVLPLVLCAIISSVAAQEVPEESTSNASAELATSGMVIDGIPELHFGKGRDCTFFGALSTCLCHLGEQVTYEYLMGVSGAAFATRFRKDWSVLSADPTVVPDHTKAALQAVGYSYEWIGSGMQTAQQLVIDSIDRGVPVVAMQLANYLDWGLIVGYSRGGDIWVCRTYHDKGADYSKAAKLPPTMLILGQKSEPPSTDELLKRSVELAVQFAKGEKRPSDSRFESGLKAFDAWADALQSSELAQTTGRQLEILQHINAWLYSCLVDARTAGVAYLRWAAKLLKGDAAKHLNEAANLYDEEVKLLKDGREAVPYPSKNESEVRWTAELRAKQIEVLRAALEKEKEAIANLEKAISSFNASEAVGPEK